MSRVGSLRAAMAAGTALAVIFASAGALAQEAQGAQVDEAEVEEVIVTAQKREERLKEVPLAITAVTAEDLERSGANALRDVVSLTPSVTFSQSQGPVQSNIAIRGVGSAGGVAGLEPSVGVYVDGVYLDRTSIGVADFNDVERIEVLRGPQGTLFGKNTPAGLINFITKRPAFEFGGDASVTVGNYNARYGSASLTGPISDKLALRVSGFYRERDGFLTNRLKNEDVNGLEAYGVRGRALWRPADDLELLFTYENHRTVQNCCAPEFAPVGAGHRTIAAALGKPFPSVIDPEDREVFFDGNFSYKHVINAYTLELNLDIGDHVFTSLSSIRDYDQRSFIDADFSQLDFFRFLGGDRDHKQFSQEFRLASPGDQDLSYVVGLFFFKKEQEERGRGVYGADTQRIFAALNSPVAPLYATIRSSQSGSFIENDSWAAFGQANYRFTPTIDASFGLRYTYDEKFISTFQTTTEVVPVLAQPRNESAQDDDGQFSGMVNLRWRPDTDTMAYVALTRGYKSFGFNDSGVNAALGQKRFFNAELSTSAEAGLKKDIDFWNTAFALTGFYTRFEDYQSSAFAPGNTFLLQNAAELTTQGIEFEAAARPITGLDLNLAYTLLDAVFDSFPTGPGLEGGAPVQDLSGKPLTDAPRHALSFVAQYDFPLGATGLEAFVRGEASYRSEYFTTQNLDPLLRQDAYSQYNARAGISGQGWAVEVWGRNLTDELILYRGGTPPAVITAGSRIRFISDPRTYGVTLRTNF